MANYDYDIGIIGGGAAGLTVAAGSAQLGAKTLLVEREPLLGGDCLQFGCVPSKTLIRSARLYHEMKNAAAYGLPEVELPPVDFRKIAERIASVIAKIQIHDSPERFCKLGAKVLFGEAEFSDEHTIRLEGKRYSAKSWVIATGSSPAIPPIEGLESTPYITNKEIFSLERLPKSMAILGAGPIATEMAQAFRRLGTKVDLIQRSGQILSKEDKDMADIVMERMRAEGVTIHLNAKVNSVQNVGNEREVSFQSEGEAKSLRAETLLVAMGRAANIQGMGLKEIGVDLARRGVTVDSRLRTNHKHIYAAGDVTGA